MGEVNAVDALLSFEAFSSRKRSRTLPCTQPQHRATCTAKDTHVCCLNNQMNKQTPVLGTKIFNNYQGLNYSVQESILILLNLPE